MNKDQVNSLVLSIIKIVGTILATHGAMKAANFMNSEDVIGAILAIVGVVMAHRYNSDTTATDKPEIKSEVK